MNLGWTQQLSIHALLAVAVLYLSMSLDGFIAGPNESDLHGGLVGAVVRAYDVAGRSMRKLQNLGRR